MANKALAKKRGNAYYFHGHRLRDVDRALYSFLQIAYELKLMSMATFHHATTTETNLLLNEDDR